MENLVFCLNATIPIFITLMLGYLFRKIGLYDDSFVSQMNKFAFKVALPAMLFLNIAEADFYEVWDTKMVVFCFVATFCSIAISIGLSFLLKPRDIQGEFVQSSYRSSAAILGMAIIQNLYGNVGMAPLMIIASVPLYNVMAVAVLSFLKPGSHGMSRQMVMRTLKGIAANPIILGIVTGLVWSMLRLPSNHSLQYSKQSGKNSDASWSYGNGRCPSFWKSIFTAEGDHCMYFLEAGWILRHLPSYCHPSWVHP